MIIFSPQFRSRLIVATPLRAREVTVESCILRNMTLQTGLLNTHPLNPEASRTNGNIVQLTTEVNLQAPGWPQVVARARSVK